MYSNQVRSEVHALNAVDKQEYPNGSDVHDELDGRERSIRSEVVAPTSADAQDAFILGDDCFDQTIRAMTVRSSLPLLAQVLRGSILFGMRVSWTFR